MFNAKQELNNLINQLTRYKNDTGCLGVVYGLSGGKDSTVVAMLAKKVFENQAVALILPNGNQVDIADGLEIARVLNLRHQIVNIQEVYNKIVEDSGNNLEQQVKFNIPPRVRMIYLYTKAQELGFRVIGTGNLSERYIGWCTKHGDMACDFNPLANLTKTEVEKIGVLLAKEFGLRLTLISKPPEDGLTMKTDEENFGFSYDVLDRYIRTGECDNEETKSKIDRMNSISAHKREMPTTFEITNSK
jgi:NAD+ synthase